MDESGYDVQLTSMAERDLFRLLDWLEDNVSLAFADKFEARFNALLEGLGRWPQQWQSVEVAGRPVRRAVIQKSWIVFYEVKPDQQRVIVMGIRGAREDWTNTPLPI